MSESGIVTITLAIINLVGVIALGYWQFKAKRKAEETAAIAQTAATAVTETAATVKATMDSTVKTIEETKAAVEQVQAQTDGHLTAMERLLKEKTEALQSEMAKVARLTGALQEARGNTGPSRREDDRT